MSEELCQRIPSAQMVDDMQFSLERKQTENGQDADEFLQLFDQEDIASYSSERLDEGDGEEIGNAFDFSPTITNDDPPQRKSPHQQRIVFACIAALIAFLHR